MYTRVQGQVYSIVAGHDRRTIARVELNTLRCFLCRHLREVQAEVSLSVR